MKLIKPTIAAIALTTMLGAPVFAQAVSAQVQRVSADSSDESAVEGGTGIIIAILAASAVIGGIIIGTDGNDQPTSP